MAQLPNVFLYDIDDLEAVVRENTKNRESELSFCNAIIDGRVAELMDKLESSAGKKPVEAVEVLPGWIMGGVPA